MIKWHCRKDWAGWQTKSGLVSRCLWPSSHLPPASAEREEVAQPGNVTRYCGPSSDLFLQSKPNQLEDSSAGQPSLLLPSQESLGAPATEQVQDRPVIIPAFVRPVGLTLYVHLPEMVTCLYAQSRHSLCAGCASKHAGFVLTYKAVKPNLPCTCFLSLLSNHHGSTLLGYAICYPTHCLTGQNVCLACHRHTS